MDRQAILARLAELRAQLSADDAPVDAIEAEVNTLETRLGELDAAETQAARRAALEARIAESQARQSERRSPRPVTGPHNDPFNRGAQSYSLVRAFRSMLDTGRLEGIERETHEELTRSYACDAGHILIPLDLPVDPRRGNEQRADFDTTGGTGLIPTIKAGTVIELLRARTLFRQLGATFLDGLVGLFDVPKITTGNTATWEAETDNPSAQAAVAGSVQFREKELKAITRVTRKMLGQTSIDVEMMLRADIARDYAVAIDKAGFSGASGGNNPVGLMYLSGPTTVSIGTDGGAPTWAKIVEMEGSVDVGNALDGSLAYVTSPKGREKLKTVLKDSGNTASTYLWQDVTNQLNGYPAYSTNQIPANLTKGVGTNLTSVIFGDFTQAIFGTWTALQVLVDPYSVGPTFIRLLSHMGADFQVRQTGAFSRIIDMTR